MRGLVVFVLITCSLSAGGGEIESAWGFYGHRLINRMAVFTLPSTMIGIYKFNIDYLSDHAVDPDKRRYASRHEAVRHYIDLDHWGEYPFANIPRKWTEMLAAYLELRCVRAPGDTTTLHTPVVAGDVYEERLKSATGFVIHNLLQQYYEDTWTFAVDSVRKYFPQYDCSSCRTILGREEFSQYGILPFHLYAMQQRLTDAFARKDLPAVLRLSADFGHYIGDAHVPLHTTKNYNGQLTGQEGIHAFWESRIPELFAEREWDFLVGQAIYIDDPRRYYWDIVLSSNRLVDDVLRIEKELSREFPEDRQYCYDERLSVVVRTQCAEYAKAYSERMQGMVEARMQDAIHAIGSAWFTAWVDGGQPEFRDFLVDMSKADREEFEALEREFVKGRAFGRTHE